MAEQILLRKAIALTMAIAKRSILTAAMAKAIQAHFFMIITALIAVIVRKPKKDALLDAKTANATLFLSSQDFV
jgi:carbamate kinase